jgi:hypothetical protein
MRMVTHLPLFVMTCYEHDSLVLTISCNDFPPVDGLAATVGLGPGAGPLAGSVGLGAA